MFTPCGYATLATPTNLKCSPGMEINTAARRILINMEIKHIQVSSSSCRERFQIEISKGEEVKEQVD